MIQNVESYGYLQSDRMKNGEGAPLPPWKENRSRLISLWDMLQFAADSFIKTLMLLRLYSSVLKESEIDRLSTLKMQAITQLNKDLMVHLEPLGLQVSISAVERINDMMKLRERPETHFIGQLIDSLIGRVEDELKFVRFLAVPPSKYHFYEQKQPLFGEQVRNNFPSASYDTDEAGKCFALDRYTACVFHLMRALEICLEVLARELSIQYEGEGNWNKVLGQFDKALKVVLEENSEKKPPGYKERERFYSEASALLRNVKNAWRNSVAHPKSAYDEDRARMVFQAVEGIMRHLATRLKEEKAEQEQEETPPEVT